MPTLWPVRNDPFSSYRAGFEVRTYRLCQRVLMFHHFPDEAGRRQPTAWCARPNSPTPTRRSRQRPQSNLLIPALGDAIRLQTPARTAYLKKSLPPLEFDYSEATIQTRRSVTSTPRVSRISLTGWTARITNGSIWMEKDSLASSPNRRMAGSTSAISARSISSAIRRAAARRGALFGPVELVATQADCRI